MSAGVARQWNGRLGKVDNGPVGVFTAVTRDGVASVLDAFREAKSACGMAESPVRRWQAWHHHLAL